MIYSSAVWNLDRELRRADSDRSDFKPRPQKHISLGSGCDLAGSTGFLQILQFFRLVRSVWRILGLQMSLPTAQILLPLGISFMTFQGIAYVVDVWRGEHAAERDLIRFLAFKAFFPQLVAGPIERASHLLDQFSRPRGLDL